MPIKLSPDEAASIGCQFLSAASMASLQGPAKTNIAFEFESAT